MTGEKLRGKTLSGEKLSGKTLTRSGEKLSGEKLNERCKLLYTVLVFHVRLFCDQFTHNSLQVSRTSEPHFRSFNSLRSHHRMNLDESKFDLDASGRIRHASAQKKFFTLR